jgi:phosphoribosylaminoimidazole-succinocarboxamide synthase
MTQPAGLYESNIPGLKLLNSGKVRDIYEVGTEHLLIVTTDRLSAFDVVLPQPIPGKGEVLTRMSNFGFNMTKDIVPNHLSNIAPRLIIKDQNLLRELGDRIIVVKRLKPLPVEAIVRGYLIGSGWKDYQANGAVCGITLPTGLKLAEKLPTILYTPSTKAAAGEHDQNISFAETVDLLGPDIACQIRDLSVQLYSIYYTYALERGIIIADTKFEFGVDEGGVVHIMDEMCTPDSSRFWPLDKYVVGENPESFDKQFVRDYLESIKWDKKPPAPWLPDIVIEKTADKYDEAERILTS